MIIIAKFEAGTINNLIALCTEFAGSIISEARHLDLSMTSEEGFFGTDAHLSFNSLNGAVTATIEPDDTKASDTF